MKILLDENIDIRFKNSFPAGHKVLTVKDMGWNGFKNGELLKLLGQEDFDCWIVVDKNIPYQQNTEKLPCSIIVLDVYRNTLPHLQILMDEILAQMASPQEEKVYIIREIK